MANERDGAAGGRGESTSTRGRDASSAMTDVARMGSEGVQRSLRGSQEAMSQGLQSATKQTERASRGMVDAIGMYGSVLQSTSERMQALLAPSQALSDGLPDVQRAAMDWLGRAMQANTRWAQELMRLDLLSNVVQAYSRFMQDSIDSLVQGSAGVLRSTDRLIRNATAEIDDRTQHQGKVGDVMTTDVRIANPDDTVQQAAQLMSEEDTGVIPVGENDRLVGMVTDRDIAVRLGAEGKDPRQTKVRDVMTPDVKYVFEDEDLDQVAQVMSAQQMRRLPVMNRDKRLVGIVSLGDIATEQSPHVAADALSRISQEAPQQGSSGYAAAAGDKPRRRGRSSR